MHPTVLLDDVEHTLACYALADHLSPGGVLLRLHGPSRGADLVLPDAAAVRAFALELATAQVKALARRPVRA